MIQVQFPNLILALLGYYSPLAAVTSIYRERLDDSEELKNAGYAEIEIDCVGQGSLEKYQSLCIRVLIFKLSIPHDHRARRAAI